MADSQCIFTVVLLYFVDNGRWILEQLEQRTSKIELPQLGDVGHSEHRTQPGRTIKNHGGPRGNGFNRTATGSKDEIVISENFRRVRMQFAKPLAYDIQRDACLMAGGLERFKRTARVDVRVKEQRTGRFFPQTIPQFKTFRVERIKN